MRNTKKLLLDTLLLSGAALVMRLLGMGFSSWLTKRIGAEGVGLYELLMSVYGFAVVLAASGVRLSVIRLVVERRQSGRCVMRLCIGYALTLGLLAGAALFCCAPLIAARWLHAPETALSLRVLAVSLPFLSVSSALNGYFTAIRRAGPYAGVQMLEQCCRIGLSILLLRSLLPRGVHYACMALVIANCGSETLSLLFALILYLHSRPTAALRPHGLLPALLSIALPDAVGSWIRSGLVTAKQLLIPRALQRSGASAARALASYGIIQGMALPVLAFPSAFLGALSGLLIPEVTECHAAGQTARMRALIFRALHATLLFSFGVMALVFSFAPTLGALLYGNSDAGRYIRILAPIIPMMYLDMIVDAFLKGLGLQTTSMRINILDAAMCLSMVLAVVPRVGIPGYLLMLALSEGLNLVLSIGKLRRITDFEPATIRNVLVPAVSSVCAILFSVPCHARLSTLLPAVPALLLSALAVTAAYIMLLLLLRSLSREDLRRLRSALR